jgi:hypothetical protein
MKPRRFSIAHCKDNQGKGLRRAGLLHERRRPVKWQNAGEIIPSYRGWTRFVDVLLVACAKL